MQCGRFPFVIKQKILALKYWKRLLECNNNMVIQNAYDSLYGCFEFGQKNLCTCMSKKF